MYSIQEMTDKAESQLKEVKSAMERDGFFDAKRANLYGGLSRSVEREMRESIRRTPLREFLVKSGTTGVAGAAYLVPAKLHDILIYASKQFDVVPMISSMITGWKGGAVNVGIVKDESLRAEEYGAGGSMPAGTADTVRATITPKAFGFNVSVNNEMIEDSQYDLVEWHFAQAAKAMGRKASDLAIKVLLTATDGDGTLNSSATGDADETKFTQGTTSDVVTAIRKLGDDEFVPDTLLLTSEAWGHSVGVHAVPTGWDTRQPSGEYHASLGMLDVLIYNSPELHASTDVVGSAFTNCISLIFDRKNALLTGRKRWMRLENYANPFEDLSGVTITSRQDSIDLYSDAIYKLTET